MIVVWVQFLLMVFGCNQSSCVKLSDFSFLSGVFWVFSFFVLIGFYTRFCSLGVLAILGYLLSVGLCCTDAFLWSILMLNVFLFCAVPHFNDYFSVDALRKRDALVFSKKRSGFVLAFLRCQSMLIIVYVCLSWIKGGDSGLMKGVAGWVLLCFSQSILFLRPEKIVAWIELKREQFQTKALGVLLYDGQCRFCRYSLAVLNVADCFGAVRSVDSRHVADFRRFHSQLSKMKCLNAVQLVDHKGRLYEGFYAFRKMCVWMPMLWPCLIFFYFPGFSLFGDYAYKWVASHRSFVSKLVLPEDFS